MARTKDLKAVARAECFDEVARLHACAQDDFEDGKADRDAEQRVDTYTSLG